MKYSTMTFAGRSIAVVFFAIVGCSKPDAATEPEHSHDDHHAEVKLLPEAITRYGVTLDTVKRRTLTPVVLAPARVDFNTDAMAHVGAALRGRAVELKVKKGDAVKRGDELLIIESPELGESQSDYLQKRAAVELACTPIEIARSAFDRAKSLYDDSKGISITELQRRDADLKSAQGSLQAAKSAVSAAENKLLLLGMNRGALDTLNQTKQLLPRYAVIAPIAGQVIDRDVTLGELVSPEKEALLVLADLQTVWLIADVPEARLGGIAVGATVQIKLPVAGNSIVQGKLTLIDPVLDPATRSAHVRIEVANNGSLRPGMFAEVEIPEAGVEGAAPVLAVPESAIQSIEGKPSVFVPVKGEEGTFTPRAIVVGKAVAGWVPASAGLSEGDAFVSAGSFILKADLGKSAAAHED